MIWLDYIRGCYRHHRTLFWKWVIELYIAFAVTVVLLIGALR